MSFKIPNISENHVEYLSKDIIEPEFMKALGPFLVLQKLLGSARVDAKNRFFTPVSLCQKIYTLFVCFATVFISYTCTYSILELFASHTKVYYIAWCAVVTNLNTCLNNVMYVRFFNGDANVAMLVNMQHLDIQMGLQHNKEINNMLYRANLIVVLCHIISCVLIVSGAFYCGGVPLGLGFLGIVSASFTFVVEMCTCVNLILYFLIRLRFINAILMNHMNPYCEDSINVSSKSHIMRMLAKSHSFESDHVDVYLRMLVNCYNGFAGLYRFQVFLFFINYIFFIFLDVEFGITGLKTNVINFQQWLASFIFLFIGLFISILLCIRCEMFLREIQKTKRLAIAIMSRHFYGHIRDKAKKMMTIIEETPPRFSVYAMWDMDARKLLEMFHLITTMLVTQLQFAFL